ncbi:MAG: hypothetical protein J0L95_10455, partial [Candidatus Accumulibacter sp.]|nr:hypothetical protein [Accumulibacter sp.]
MAMRVFSSLTMLVLVSACGTIDWRVPPSAENDGVDHAFTQSPNPTLSRNPVQAVALVGAAGYAVGEYASNAAYLGFGAAAAVAAYVVYDPLAPNWTIEGVPQAHRKEVRNGLTNCVEATRKMRVGPSGSAFRSGPQTTPS